MKDAPDELPEPGAQTSGVAVLDRAFALLAAFGPADLQLNLTELSRRTGLYKSTVLRLLAALEHGGFIRRLPDGQYAIGPQPLRLASLYQRSFDVGHVIEPLLKQLSQSCGETASFYVRQGDKRIALFRVEPSRSIRASVQIGQEYALSQGASGKVLLAYTEPVAGPLETIKEQLWAASYGERDPETASAAAPVFGVAGDLQGAMTVSGPMARLTPGLAMDAVCLKVLQAARDATAALGGSTARYQKSLDGLGAH